MIRHFSHIFLTEGRTFTLKTPLSQAAGYPAAREVIRTEFDENPVSGRILMKLILMRPEM